MQVNLFTFFREQGQRWRRENKHRSEDYIQGGVCAIRETGDLLTARKDVVDIDKLSTKLAESEKENREVQQRNKVLNEQQRTIITKYEKLQREHEAIRLNQLELQQQLGKKVIQANAVGSVPVKPAKGNLKNKNVLELKAEIGSLRHRIATLEALLVADGKSTTTPESNVANLQNQVNLLQKKLDLAEGKERVGSHVLSPGRIVKQLSRFLGRVNLSAADRLLYISRSVDNYKAVLEGREPEEWPEAEQPLSTAAHQPA